MKLLNKFKRWCDSCDSKEIDLVGLTLSVTEIIIVSLMCLCFGLLIALPYIK